jgi:hypothetical protein
MLQVAMADCGGSHHERAVGYCFGYGLVLFGAGQHRRGTYGGTGTLKCHLVGIHYAQVVKSKIAHRPSGRADVEGIARVHQDNAQSIEFSSKRQAVRILRQTEFTASLLPQSPFTPGCECKRFVKTSATTQKMGRNIVSFNTLRARVGGIEQDRPKLRKTGPNRVRMAL